MCVESEVCARTYSLLSLLSAHDVVAGVSLAAHHEQRASGGVTPVAATTAVLGVARCSAPRVDASRPRRDASSSGWAGC